MEILQKEIPVLFANVSHLPRNSLIPLIDAIIQKASAPFSSSTPEEVCNLQSLLQELSYFPSLPKIRERGTYKSDCHSSKVKGCTKQSSGHPSLLPGIFTLFCPNGERSPQFILLCNHIVRGCRNLLWVSGNAGPRIPQCTIFSVVHEAVTRYQKIIPTACMTVK